MPAYLLDKDVIRRTIEGTARVQRKEAPFLDQAVCLALLHAAVRGQFTAYITPQSLHILERLACRDEVRDFLDEVEVMQRGRYVRRWARRLREHGFTREDTAILSMATFGTDAEGAILGVDVIVTLDLPFINNFYMHRPTLERRLKAMARQLVPPFRDVGLPDLWPPTRALVALLRT